MSGVISGEDSSGRKRAGAVMQVDPERGRERLAGMGVSDRDVAVAIRLNELKRLPAILLPEQRSIALGRPGGLSGGSE